jgi:hypothetical protein
MPLAQVLKFDQRVAMGRRRPVQAGSTGVVLQLFRAPRHRSDLTGLPMGASDADQFAGRGRDPG